MLRVSKLGCLSLGSFSALFFIGVVCRVVLCGSNSFPVFCAALAASILLLLSCRRLNVFAGVFFIGFSYAGIYSCFFEEKLLPETLDGKVIKMSGFLVDFPRASERGWQFDFYAAELDGKIRLTVETEEADQSPPGLSCLYTLDAKVKKPRALVNIGAFDYQAWLLQAGYIATGYVRSLGQCETRDQGLIQSARSYIAHWVNSSQASVYAKSTLLGLLIGSYADIDSLQWQLLRDSGTIHLLSVSGLHIVLVASLAHFCTRRLVSWLVFPLRWMPAAWWAGLMAIAIALFYSLLAGFSVATQRSLVMVIVAVLQRIFYGRLYFATALLVSMAVIVIINPLSVLSSSFWFSFVATGILLLSGYGILHIGWPKILSSSYAVIRIQLLIFLLMAPVMLYVYGKLPLLSLPVNFIAVPWVSLVSLPLAFFAAFVLPLSESLADVILELSGSSLDLYWSLVGMAIDYAGHWQLSLGGVSLLAAVLCILGLAILWLFPLGMPLRYSGLVLCLPMIFPSGLRINPGEADVMVLDVGQGLAVTVRTARHSLVYDTGARSSARFDAGRDIVAVALRNMRIDHIDMLMITHADSDHAGGRAGLLQEVKASQLWSGTPEQLTDASSYLPCRAGMHWRWDEVSFRVIWPDSREDKHDNNRGCVLLVEANNRRLLLAADIEKPAELALLDSGVDLHADVLLAPHHGSKTSSVSQFLDRVNASTAIVSAGFNNRFHHPSRSVVERYLVRGMKVINTADVGAIRLRLSARGVDIRTALCDRQYFWRRERYNAHCR